LEPFVNCARNYGKGLFILAKTSNPGSGWLQDKPIEGARVSDRIAALVGGLARDTKGVSGLSSIGAVVGATYPEDGRRLRALMPDSILLAPGVGAQGASIENIHALRRPDGGGVLVPVSRGIAKVTDRSLSIADYAELIRGRIASFKEMLA
jgi:orotidine-5'-phosphate decarboxylase